MINFEISCKFQKLNSSPLWTFRLGTWILFMIWSLCCVNPSGFAQQIAIDSLKNLLRNEQSDTNVVILLSKISHKYLSLDHEESKAFAEQGLGLAKKIGFQKGEIRCLNNLGSYFRERGNNDRALDYYQKALHQSKENAFGITEGDCLVNIGVIYFYQGDYDKTIKYYLQALQLYEKARNRYGISICMNNIGGVYYYQNNYEKALEFFLKTVAMEKEDEDKLRIAASYVNIGEVYRMLGNFDSSIVYQLRSIEMKGVLDDREDMGSNYNNLGAVYFEIGEIEKATEYYLKSLEIREAINDLRGMAIALGNLGEAHSIQKNYKDANQCLNKSLEIAKSIGLREQIKAVYEYLSKSYHVQNDFKSAYEYQGLYSLMKDSLFNEDKSKEIGKLEANYELEKEIEEENRIAKEMKSTLAEAQLRRDNLQYSGILIFLVLMSAGLLVIGSFGIPIRLAEGLIFFTFLLFFEFSLVLLDPYIEQYSAGAPAIKLTFNAVLAALIFPLHSFFEEQIKKRITG